MADEVLGALARIDVLVNNVGGYWNTAARDGRWARAHLRAQPPRPVPAHPPARRPVEAERAGARRQRLLGGPRRPGGSTSTTSRASGATPGSGPTASRSSPTCCSPTNWPSRLDPGAVTANVLHPGVVRTGFGAEDPGFIQRLFVPFVRPFMKIADRRRGHVYLRRFLSRSRPDDRPVLRQLHAEAILEAQLRHRPRHGSGT